MNESVLSGAPAFLSVEVPLSPESKEPPSEIRLFKSGKIKVKKAGQSATPDFDFTERSAKAVLSGSTEWGIRHSMDWEHKALYAAMGAGDGRAPAAAWYELKMKDDGLYAVNIEWTAQGKADVLSKQYRYISPAFDYDKETREITFLINASLTNLPATVGISPIMANALGQGPNNQKESSAMLKTTIGVLGLADGASEAEALAKISNLNNFRATVIATTGKTTEAEALASLQAMKAAETRVAALSAEVEELKRAGAKAEVQALLSQCEEKGLVEPGSKMREYLATQPADGIRAFMASAVPVVKPGGKGGPKPLPNDGKAAGEGGVAALSAAQRAAMEKVARASGTDIKELEKTWLTAIDSTPVETA